MKKTRVKIQLSGLYKEEVDAMERWAGEMETSINNWILDTLRENLLSDGNHARLQEIAKGPLDLSVYVDSVILDEFNHRHPRQQLPVWIKSVVRQKLSVLRNA